MAFNRSKIILALACAISFVGPLWAEDFVQIEVGIDFKAYMGSDTNKFYSRHISIQCVTGPDKWRIDNDYLQGGFMNWMYDGTNVLQSSQQLRPPPPEHEEQLTKKFGLTPKPFEQARTNHHVRVFTTPGGYPPGDLAVTMPWLAFCSGSYLKHENRSIPPISRSTSRMSQDAFAYRDKTQVFEDNLGLPRMIELFNSKSLFEKSLQTRGLPGYIDLKAWTNELYHLPDGALKFRYGVTSSTNFLGKTYPLTFEFFQFGVSRATGKWFREFVGAGSALAFKPCPAPASLLNPTLSIQVTDYRFHPDLQVTYSGKLRSTNDTELQSQLREKVTQYLTASPKKGGQRIRLLK